jgi:dihydrofolate synthase/folylpolyglutamate synthase
MSRHIESYEQAIEFLYNRINYERVSGSSYTAADFRLDRMRELLRRLGDPQKMIPAVHIAGTKGKGSTAAMINRIAMAAGYRTGLFTSPHLTAFEERMSVNGQLPTPEQIVELVNAVSEPVAEMDKSSGRQCPTYFEIATAMAWLYFANQRTDLAVLEVGLGGRLDATNVCQPEVTVITTISRDHTRHLGSRLSQIAWEKAGIVKPGIPVVSGVTQPEPAESIATVCREVSAPLWQLSRDFSYHYAPPHFENDATGEPIGTLEVTAGDREWSQLPIVLRGEHQAHNAAVAVMTVDLLRQRGWEIPELSFADGLRQVRWPARIEVVATQPTVIVDAAHNWAAIAALLKTLGDFPVRRKVLVFAATQDKDVGGMLRQLLPMFDSVVVTNYLNNPRAVGAEELSRHAAQLTVAPIHLTHDPVSAWKLAQRLASPEDLICITGSFFIAAEMRDLILDASEGNASQLPPRDDVGQRR